MKGMRDRQIWLLQFNKSPEDLALATRMLKSLLYIDHSYLKTLLANVIIGQLVNEGPCALFIERELPRTKSTRPPAMSSTQRDTQSSALMPGRAVASGARRPLAIDTRMEARRAKPPPQSGLGSRQPCRRPCPANWSSCV